MVDRREQQTPQEESPTVELGQWFRPFQQPDIQSGDLVMENHVSIERKFVVRGAGVVTVRVFWEEGVIDFGEDVPRGMILLTDRMEITDARDFPGHEARFRRLMGFNADLTDVEVSADSLLVMVKTENGDEMSSKFIKMEDAGEETSFSAETSWRLGGRSVESHAFVPYSTRILESLQMRIVQAGEAESSNLSARPTLPSITED